MRAQRPGRVYYFPHWPLKSDTVSRLGIHVGRNIYIRPFKIIADGLKYNRMFNIIKYA